jgi:polygalacturonase
MKNPLSYLYHLLFVFIIITTTFRHCLYGDLSIVTKANHRVEINVTNYGVVGDGTTDDTIAMQNIFNTIIPFKRKRSNEARIVVIIPKRCVVLCGPLTIRSIDQMVLKIDGRLQAWDISIHNSLGNWPMIDPLPTYGNSRDIDGLHYQYQPFIYMDNVTNAHITGAGVVDGCGQSWWDIITSKNQSTQSQLLAGRPNLIQIIHSSHIEIDAVTLQNSPFWTLHPILSQYIHIHHMSIDAPLYAPNVDGIDPEYVQMDCFLLRVVQRTSASE